MIKVLPIEQDGVVQESLRGATFKVILANGHMVRAQISGRMRKNYIKIIPGDKVKMELSPFDLTQARIVHRYKISDPDSKSIHHS